MYGWRGTDVKYFTGSNIKAIGESLPSLAFHRYDRKVVEYDVRLSLADVVRHGDN
jgi:hypothetical protein